MKFSTFSLIILILFFSSIFFISCGERTGTTVIEKKVLIDILTDLHITDALLANKGMYDGKLKDTTESYYNFVLKKYDISRAEFDYSLDYYINNAEEYLLIYDEVIAIINEKMPRRLHDNSIYKIFEEALREAEILGDLEKYYGRSGRELWIGRRAGKVPKDTTSLKLKIEKEANYQCLIVLNSEVKLEPEDSSQNLRMVLELSYKDSTKVADTAFFASDKEKEWQWRRIILKTDSMKEPKMIKANLLEQENDKNIPKLQIRNISLKQYAPDKDTSKLPDFSKANAKKPKGKKVTKKVRKNPKKKTNSGLELIK